MDLGAELYSKISLQELNKSLLSVVCANEGTVRFNSSGPMSCLSTPLKYVEVERSFVVKFIGRMGS